MSYDENCSPLPGQGMSFASGVFRPRFVGAQSKEPRPSEATMRRRPAQPADPAAPARAPQSPDEERSGRQLCQMHNGESLL